MKKAFISILFIFCVFIVFGTEITLSNNSESLLYYYIPGTDDSVVADLLDDAEYIKSFIYDNVESFAYLPSEAYYPINIDLQNDPVIFGFFASPNDIRYPAFANSVPMTAVTGLYEVSLENAIGDPTEVPLFVYPDELIWERENVVLDNIYLDWLKVPETARFSNTFNPVVYSQENFGDLDSKSITSSLYWQKGGSQLQSIKSFLSNGALYLMLSSIDKMEESISYFFYLFDKRTENETCRYTIEIPIRDKTGVILLWVDGEKSPIVVGQYVRSSYFIEGRIFIELSPINFDAELLDNLSFDVTSCFFNSTIYEEFYFTTIFLRDIPRY
jgi:hypothetical protein